jgi:hypothetical protein
MYKASAKDNAPISIQKYISLKLLNLYEFIAKKQQKIGANTIIANKIKSARGIKASTKNHCKAILFIYL